jgi:hypothetical protein
MFEEQKVADVINKYYVPTLVMRSESGEELALSKIVPSPKTELTEVIVLESNGKEVGRFLITREMQFSAWAIENKLVELAKR